MNDNEKKHSRKCPICDKTIFHKSKYHRNTAEKNKQICRQCSNKKNSDIMIGENNPFFGRKHSEKTKLKIIESLKKIDYSYCRTKEFKEKTRRPGKLNGMYGRSIYDVWTEKYGEQEANKRLVECRRKQSLSESGKNNPMYGRPTPVGSGNGWSGWYKKWYFRSIRELSYMINVIEKNNYKWRTAETNDLKISYVDYFGISRTYRADFLLNEKILIEVKPIKLFNTLTNILKKRAAIEFCKQNNMEYRIVDVKPLGIDILKSMYENKDIIFIERYEEKMEKFLCKLKKKKQ
jgi:hypothetical protein